MIGERPVKLWEMPEPPAQSTREMFEALKVKMGLPRIQVNGNDQGFAANVDESAVVSDGSQGSIRQPVEHGESTISPYQSNARHGGRTQFPPNFDIPPEFRFSPSQHNMTEAEMHKIIDDITNEAQAQQMPPNTTLAHFTAPTQIIKQPASPPPDYLPSCPSSRKSNHEPAYWVPKLSHNINRWLEQPSTQSSQIQLDMLELRTKIEPEEDSPVLVSTDDSAVMKLTRMRLTASNTKCQDWLVLQRKRLNGISKAETTSYWVLAFPMEAITDWEVQTPPSLSQQQFRLSEGFNAIDGYESKLFLGGKDRVPIVHGRGIDPRFAQEFIQACAVGEGVVYMGSGVSLEGILKLR